MADNTNNMDNTNNDCYKITICDPDGKEEVYETNLAFLICDVGDRIEVAQLCRNGLAFDIFQLVRVGQRAIVEMIPEKYLKLYEAFISSTPENEENEEDE